MALEKTVSTVQALVAANAYHRVESIQFKDKANINFYLRSYVSTNNPFFSEEFISCAYDINGENPFKQAYKYLKTLPKFSEYVDC